MSPRLVLVTDPNLEEGRHLTGLILSAHLAACVNILPQVESHYWWQGKIERAEEVLLLVKSSAEQFEQLSALIRERHTYGCPEIVAIELGDISAPYRAWWEGQLQE